MVLTLPYNQPTQPSIQIYLVPGIYTDKVTNAQPMNKFQTKKRKPARKAMLLLATYLYESFILLNTFFVVIKCYNNLF